MKLSSIVARLRANTGTVFTGGISGAADLARLAEREGTYPAPTAFVVPLAEQATANDEDNQVNQTNTERFLVVVVVDNSTKPKDKEGVIAHDELETMRQSLWDTLLGWYPENSENAISFVRGELLEINRYRLWYQFEFEYRSQITFSPPAENLDDLLSIHNTIEMGDEDTVDDQITVELSPPIE